MSQDSYPEYKPDPEHSGNVPPPQNPYGTPPQAPYGVPPSQNPYQVPPQTYYGEQPPLPYGMPPQGTYGGPGYNPNQGTYGYYASAPLPLGQAISQLPNQYIKVLTRPSSFTFAAEMGKANWDILWVQLIGYAVIAGILNYLRILIFHVVPINYNNSDGAYLKILSALQTYAQGSSFYNIILTPIFFFIGEGIIYLLAKAFGGTGTFLRQSYTYLLIIVPISIIASALNFIPILGSLVGIGLSIYAIVLQIFSLMPVHRISGGKATAVVLIPMAVLFVLAIILVFIVFIVIVIAVAASVHPSP